METKIASYQEPGIRIQLVRVEIEDMESDEIPTALTKIKYQVRRNRKIILTTEDIDIARSKMTNIIYTSLLQLKIQL